MGHSVEEVYRKCAVLHEKALMLHRKRYNLVDDQYDEQECKNILEDLQALALELAYDRNVDFNKPR